MIVVWQVTEHCNLSCPFCAFDRSIKRLRADADPKRLLRFGEVLAQYQQETGDPVLVSWLGGEPLLWEPLEKISSRFVHVNGLQVATTTNGTALRSAKTRRHLIDCYSEITVSIDAIGDAHDEIRGAPGLFSSLSSAIRQLAEESKNAGGRLQLRANIVLMHHTIRSFASLCAELADWGIDEISFNQLGGNDRPEFYPQNRLSPEDAALLTATIPRLRAKLAMRGVRLLGSVEYLRRMDASSRNEAVAVHDCRPGAAFLFVDRQGRLAPCSFTADRLGISVDELNSVDDLRRLPTRFASAIEQCRPTACDDCLSTRVFAKFSTEEG